MNLAEWMQKYRSNVGNILLVVVLILATPDAVSITIGFFVLLSGALFRAWCAGYISDDDFPRVGPYSLSRNPMAFGNLLIGIGVAVGGNNLYVFLIFIVYYLAFFPVSMIRRQRKLKDKYGKDYEVWKKRTNVFVPRIKKIVPGEYNISSYMKSKEYRVIYFSLFVIAVLVFKFIRSAGMP